MSVDQLRTNTDVENRENRDNFVRKFLSIKSTLTQHGVETLIVSTSHDFLGNMQRATIRLCFHQEQTQDVLKILQKAGISIQQHEESQQQADGMNAWFRLILITGGYNTLSSHTKEIIIYEGLALTNEQFDAVQIKN